MKSTLSRPKARAALLEQLEHAMRRSSAQGVIFGQTVAGRAGIWASYSDVELQLLLRFATEGYKTMLAATEELKASIEPSTTKRAGATKGARTP
jgi:hypothetical protein